MDTADDIRLKIMKGEMKYMGKTEAEEYERKLKEQKVAEAQLLLGKTYEDILSFMDGWIDIPLEYKKIITIWIIGTYFHKQFETYPYIFLNAMKGSGKTRLLKIMSWLQCRGKGDVLTQPSDAVIFHTAQETGLIFDEFESEKSKDKQAMREYLNAAYKKGGVVYRMEKHKIDGKEAQVAIPHYLYTPVAMANIGGIEDVLGDRSLTLILEKSMNPALVKKIENFAKNPKIQEIKKNLEKISVELCSVYLLQKSIEEWNSYVDSKYSTLLLHIHTIHNDTSLHTKELNPNNNILDNPDVDLELKGNNNLDDLELFNRIDDTGIFGRNLELLLPLIITSKLIGESVFEEFLGIARGFNKLKKEDEFAESKDVVLIEFVSKAEKYRFEYVFVHDLFQEFKQFLGNLIDPNDKTDNWINVTWLGLALKRLKLIHDRRRVAKGVMVLLDVDKAREKIKIFKTDEKMEEKDEPAKS
jgi:hypothetical protein